MGAVYWVGQDGNVWLKNNAGQVSNQGHYLGGNASGFDSANFSAEAQRIDDPNPGGGGGGNRNTGGGGGGRGYGYAPSSAAQAAQTARQEKYITDQADQTKQGELAAGQTAADNYNTQGLNLVDQLRQGETGINQARLGIANDQINSIKSLVNNIRQGLQGSAVQLGNTNALDSSAANVISRAYANYGNQQRNVINNDAAVKNQAQDTAQQNLDLQRAEGTRNLGSYKESIINQIGLDTMQKLDAVDGIAQLQGLGGKVDINGIKNAVIANAQQKIADADNYIQQQLGGIAPTSAQDIATKAYALNNSGVLPSSGGLTYQLAAPGSNPQVQQGGAPTSELPLVLAPKGVKTS